jgi:rubredoxin-NAD+ reductase
VEAIDPVAKTLRLGSGERRYAKLVIAAGATPFRPPMQGDAAEEVLSVNNLGDYARFRERLEGRDRVAIIGPGLIGCEFANDLLHAHKQITLIGPDPWPISGLVPEAVGRALQQSLEAAGVGWQLGRIAASVAKSGDGYTVELDNGDTLEADLILSAVGLRADVGLASRAGLACNRGIVCDATLKTSADDIYALGDCAEVEGRHLPYVMPLMAGAKALASTLAGERREVVYPLMPVVIKTSRHPVVVMPPEGKEGSWQVEGDEAGVRARWLDHSGALAGFALSGDRVGEKQTLLKEIKEGRADAPA